MRGHSFVDGLDLISVWKSYIDVGIFEPESRIDIGSDFVVSFHDVFNINIDEVVERVSMLFDETFDF